MLIKDATRVRDAPGKRAGMLTVEKQALPELMKFQPDLVLDCKRYHLHGLADPLPVVNICNSVSP